MSDNRVPRDPHKQRLNPWLLGIIISFIVVLGVNAVMIYQSVHTFSGVTTANHYEQGKAFNTLLAERQKQKDLGISVSYSDSGLLKGEMGTIRLSFRDPGGNPLTGIKVTGLLYRNAHAGVDQPVTAVETGSGNYEARVTPPEAGLWEMRLDVTGRMGPLHFNQPITVGEKKREL
ncbi:MAG: FixH family protein [Magnetococcales bacterium]|nr:FixH family protein [Magnetococcales bacterium]